MSSKKKSKLRDDTMGMMVAQMADLRREQQQASKDSELRRAEDARIAEAKLQSIQHEQQKLF